MLLLVWEVVDPLSNCSLHTFLSRIYGGKWEIREGAQGASMEERERALVCLQSVWVEQEDNWSRWPLWEGQKWYLYPSGPNGRLSAAVPHLTRGSAAPNRQQGVKTVFGWLFWLGVMILAEMVFWAFSSNVAKGPRIPLNSTAYPKLKIQDINEFKPSWCGYATIMHRGNFWTCISSLHLSMWLELFPYMWVHFKGFKSLPPIIWSST
jgi:hypothetical protein